MQASSSFDDEQAYLKTEIKKDKTFEDPQFDEGEGCDEACKQEKDMLDLLDHIDSIVSIYVLLPLCIFGIVFNFASIGALLHNKLCLRISLIQLFMFLNTSDV